MIFETSPFTQTSESPGVASIAPFAAETTCATVRVARRGSATAGGAEDGAGSGAPKNCESRRSGLPSALRATGQPARLPSGHRIEVGSEEGATEDRGGRV